MLFIIGMMLLSFAIGYISMDVIDYIRDQFANPLAEVNQMLDECEQTLNAWNYQL